MSKSLDNLYKNQSHIFKYILYLASIFFIVFFFPRGGKFKYEFQKGKPWQYENLYAPFDFSIKKGDAEVEQERMAVVDNQINYYTFNTNIAQKAYNEFDDKFMNSPNLEAANPIQKSVLKEIGVGILDELYVNGVLPKNAKEIGSRGLYLVKQHEAEKITFNQIYNIGEVNGVIHVLLQEKKLEEYEDLYVKLFSDIIIPNVTYDESLSLKAHEEELSKISYTRGNIDEGKLIIAKGEVVEAENFKILNSLKQEYESELWNAGNYYFILFGYTVLVALVLMMLFLFLKKYRNEIFRNNTKVTFIFFNILLMVFITTLVVKYNETYVFLVPLCILPIILKTFFDARLGLFVHVLTVLLLGFVVPNSFEYIFLQTVAGIVTILTVSEMHKRTNLFVSVGQIILIYVIGYLAFHIIYEGTLDNIEWIILVVFLLNGVITLAFAQPLIYIYEKLFGLVSDVSLLELSDTNSKLLKELSNKAPGTFHHSLQVANLAEAAANEIGANAMMVRVGALYHDIGKMNNPTYFTENQITNVNPHDELMPVNSAKIIIDHVIEGIEIARKNNLPDRIIDFIRTHHGTNVVYYFYKKQQEQDDEVKIEDYSYPGPIPFSKETAILMMADSVEAASKSLKNPTYQMIDEFVNKIIEGQMQANQFLNANITFKEIETVKKVLKQKLTNVYHLRIEYPE
ncbi:MAG: phosphohydrolase [Flavobacteriaceae bacterium]|nr:MAG: phosphohydrolase [Flavobacteriaceae bacterium]